MKDNGKGRQSTRLKPLFPSQSIHHLFSCFTHILGAICPIAGVAWDDSSLRRYTTRTYLRISPVIIVSVGILISFATRLMRSILPLAMLSIVKPSELRAAGHENVQGSVVSGDLLAYAQGAVLIAVIWLAEEEESRFALLYTRVKSLF